LEFKGKGTGKVDWNNKHRGSQTDSCSPFLGWMMSRLFFREGTFIYGEDIQSAEDYIRGEPGL
jgi:hypothetical protein